MTAIQCLEECLSFILPSTGQENNRKQIELLDLIALCWRMIKTSCTFYSNPAEEEKHKLQMTKKMKHYTVIYGGFTSYLFIGFWLPVNSHIGKKRYYEEQKPD